MLRIFLTIYFLSKINRYFRTEPTKKIINLLDQAKRKENERDHMTMKIIIKWEKIIHLLPLRMNRRQKYLIRLLVSTKDFGVANDFLYLFLSLISIHRSILLHNCSYRFKEQTNAKKIRNSNIKARRQNCWWGTRRRFDGNSESIL